MATFSQGIELVSVITLVNGGTTSYTIPTGHYGKVSWNISSQGFGKSTSLKVDSRIIAVVFSGSVQVAYASGSITLVSGSSIFGQSNTDGAGGIVVGIEIYKNP